MKKKSVFLLSLLFAAMLCFTLAACKTGGIALKDFPSESTETVELGSVYTLKTRAEGEDGNTYRLSAKVSTKDSVAVPVFDDRFDVTDVSGYVITYTAITGDDTQTSVVTLNVTDNTAPIIGINKPDGGILNEEYRLPVITVSDLAGTQPEVTVKVYHVDGDVRTEVTGLTERDGRYYFTPSAIGNYEIEVTAQKANGQSKTATRSFVVDSPVEEGEVFSPVVFDPASQISFVAAGGVAVDKIAVNKVTPEETDGAYTGSYLSLNGKDVGTNVWVDIHLTPRLSVEEYADYDIVEFWVYFKSTSETVKIGILGGSTGATDPLLREFPGNTWSKISVDADTFFDKIGSKRLFTVNFNNASSSNHAGVDEIWLGSVMAKYSFAPSVTVDAPEAAPNGTSAVTLTADTDVAFTAEIKDAQGSEQTCSVQNGTVTAQLPMGSYTYTLTSADDMYIGSVSGSFTVESNTKIVLPEAESGTAGAAYTIPDASVTVNGQVQEGVKAAYTATFIQGLNGEKSETVESGFVPLTAGTLTIVYTYDGAASQSIEIDIAPAAASGNVIFSPATATHSNIVSHNGAQRFEAKAGDPSAEYTGSYIEITAPETSGWSNTRLTLGIDENSYAAYDKVGVWVYFVAAGKVSSSLFNDDAYKEVYAPNEWHLILVDRDAFITKMTGLNKDLLALNFNSPQNGNFPNLTSVRLGEIVGLYNFDDVTVPQNISANEGENAEVTITVNENAEGITAVIKNAEGVEQECSVSGNEITASLPAGEYTYEIATTDAEYTGTITGSFIINSKTQIILPEETSGTAMEEFTIPEAQISVDGAITEDRADYTAVFTPNYGDDVVEDISTATFTPASSGTLVIAYSYEGAVSRTLNVVIEKAENTTGALLDMRNADVLENVNTNDVAGSRVRYDADQNYLVWESAVGSSTAWRRLSVNFGTTNADLIQKGIYYVAVEVYYKTTDQATADVVGWLCDGKFKVGETSANERIPRNTWYTIYIPTEYLTDSVLNGSKDLLQVIFEYGNSRFNYIEEVYMKGFKPVTQAEIDETYTFYDPSAETTDGIAIEGTSGEVSIVPETEKPYLSWKGTEPWDKLAISDRAPAFNAFTTYQYVAVEVYYVAEDSSKVVSGYFAGAQYLIGTASTSDDIGLAVNQWITVYIPIDTFYTNGAVSGALGGSNYLISCGFTNGTHFPGITEVRLGNIYFTNDNGQTE